MVALTSSIRIPEGTSIRSRARRLGRQLISAVDLRCRFNDIASVRKDKQRRRSDVLQFHSANPNRGCAQKHLAQARSVLRRPTERRRGAKRAGSAGSVARAAASHPGGGFLDRPQQARQLLLAGADRPKT